MSSEISTLTKTQEIVLAVLTIATGLASILGSSLIIYLFVKSPKRTRTPYKRILLGMSISDIVASMGFILQPWLAPSETSQRALSIGNEGTCSFLGFMWQLSFSTFLYNGSLSFYYLFTIRLGVSERDFSRRVEPAMHILSVGFPLITAVVGVAMGIFRENELGVGCWINDYPRGCGDDEGDTDENCLSDLLAWLFGGIPVFLIMVAVLVNNLLIYLFVRRTIYRSLRRSPAFASSSTATATAGRGAPRPQRLDSQTRRVQAVAVQAALYVGAFIFTYAWSISVRILESMGFDSENEQKLFPLYFLMSLFSPLTGFLNLMVYLRPQYLRTRGSFPRERRVWAARRALFGDVVKPEEPQRRPAKTDSTVSIQQANSASVRNAKNKNQARGEVVQGEQNVNNNNNHNDHNDETANEEETEHQCESTPALPVAVAQCN